MLILKAECALIRYDFDAEWICDLQIVSFVVRSAHGLRNEYYQVGVRREVGKHEVDRYGLILARNHVGLIPVNPQIRGV